MDDKKINDYLKALSLLLNLKKEIEREECENSFEDDVFVSKISVNKLNGVQIKSEGFDSPLFEKVTGLTKEEFRNLVKKHLDKPYENLARELSETISAKGKNVATFDLVRNRKL